VVPPAPTAEQVRAALRTGRQCPVDTCVLLGGGMNSSAWEVVAGCDRYVAKLVPATERSRFVAGELLDGYLSAGPLTGDELDAALPTMLRFRYAVQADYFAYRLHVDDRTGIAGPADNHLGLDDARAGLDRCAEE